MSVLERLAAATAIRQRTPTSANASDAEPPLQRLPFRLSLGHEPEHDHRLAWRGGCRARRAAGVTACV